MILFKQMGTSVGWEQNLVMNNEFDQLFDQLLSFLHYNCYLRVNCTVLFKLFIW